jgi:hypothetical protein
MRNAMRGWRKISAPSSLSIGDETEHDYSKPIAVAKRGTRRRCIASIAAEIAERRFIKNS